MLKKSHNTAKLTISKTVQGLFMKELHHNYYFDLTNYQHRDLFKDCEHVWEVLPRINTYLQQQHLGVIDIEVPEGVTLVNKELISIGAGTVVEPGAYIKGPCIIGENCQIRQGAYIRGNVICGNECVIGHATEIKNSLLLNYACAAHFNYLGDTVLGNNTNLGAGTICANLRFDKSPVRVFCRGRHVDTRLKKFGAVFGDLSQSGCNSVLNPGTLLGKGAGVYPCVNAGGLILEGQVCRVSGNVSQGTHT